MRCSNCGAELENGVLFCRDCGAKIEPSLLFCKECGAPLEAGARFCRDCGAVIKTIKDVPKYDNSSHEKNTKTVVIRNKAVSTKNGIKQNTDTIKTSQNNSSKDAINNLLDNSILKIVIIIAAVALCIILIVSAIIKKKNPSVEGVTPIASQIAGSNIDYTIGTDRTYAYMSDGWNVYIAIPVSSKAVKIEHWHKTMSSTKKMSFSEDIGTYKLDSPEVGFYWIDADHTAFVFNIVDKNNSQLSKGKQVVFTINISDTDICKGTDFDEAIACYTYMNDDWHEYRAIPLTDSLIKIEVWSRTSSSDKLLFGYDLCLINTESNETDFEWGDDSKSAFTITMNDPENDYYWKGSKFVSYMLANEGYTYPSVKAYLGLERSENKLPEDNRTQRNEYDEKNNSIEFIGRYSFSVPTYWDADITENDHYRAYAETSGKVAMLEIRASFDDEDPVTYESLVEENNNGAMEKAFRSWFDECGDISSESFDNGIVKGFIYSTHGLNEGYNVYTEYMTFPSVEDNKWMSVVLTQTDNTQFSYTDDFRKILSSVKLSDDQRSSNDSIKDEGSALNEKATNKVEQDTSMVEEQESNDDLSKGESVYDLAYERALSGFSMFYLIDTDAKECISFMSTDGYGYYGEYTGDLSSEIKVTYPYEGYSDTITFRNGKGSDADVRIGSDRSTFEFKNISVEKAEKYLKKIYKE